MEQVARTEERAEPPALSRADLERLSWLRVQIERGVRSEFPMGYRRLLFAKYLYEQKRISG